MVALFDHRFINYKIVSALDRVRKHLMFEHLLDVIRRETFFFLFLLTTNEDERRARNLAGRMRTRHPYEERVSKNVMRGKVKRTNNGAGGGGEETEFNELFGWTLTGRDAVGRWKTVACASAIRRWFTAAAIATRWGWIGSRSVGTAMPVCRTARRRSAGRFRSIQHGRRGHWASFCVWTCTKYLWTLLVWHKKPFRKNFQVFFP